MKSKIQKMKLYENNLTLNIKRKQIMWNIMKNKI